MKRHALSIATTVALLALAPLAHASATTDDSAITTAGTPVVIDVLANDAGLGTPRALRILLKPKHGQAHVQNGQVVYTPAAGFTGTDTLQYTAKGSAGRHIGAVHIVVGQGLVLQGKVTDSPIANALVTATVDGFHFSTTADADGNYSLPIVGLGDPMVTMAAQGTGAQSAASFLSVLGEFDRLKAESGDGTLTRDENNQVQVTNVSTAQAYLLQLANDGAPIIDDAQLVTAREGLANGQLLNMAAAIKLVVDAGYALPAGVTDTLALISDQAALASFTQAVNADDPDAFGAAMNEIAADPDLTVPAAATDMVGTYTLVYDLGKPGTVSNGYIQGHRVTLNADGTGTYIKSAPNMDPSLTWTFENGRAVIVPNAPVVSTSYVVINGVQMRQLTTDTRIELVKLFEGNGRDTLAITTTSTFSYPDNPGIPGGTRTGTSTNIGIRDEQGIMPIDAADLVGTTRAVWVADTPYANANFTGMDLFAFQAGGLGQRGNGTTFSWTVDGLGRLLVAFANGDQASYAQINEDGRKGEGIAAEWRSNAGARSAATSMSMEVDGEEFTTANAAQQWRSGFNASRSNDDGADMFMVLDADNRGWAVAYFNGAATGSTPLGWSVNGGVLDATYYRNGSNQHVHYCDVGINGCYIWQVRRWRPVAADDNRAYVIEEFLWDSDLDGDLDVTNQRANFYDASVAPQFAPAPAAAGALPKLKAKR